MNIATTYESYRAMAAIRKNNQPSRYAQQSPELISYLHFKTLSMHISMHMNASINEADLKDLVAFAYEQLSEKEKRELLIEDIIK